jgi:hypothetical protein
MDDGGQCYMKGNERTILTRIEMKLYNIEEMME